MSCPNRPKNALFRTRQKWGPEGDGERPEHSWDDKAGFGGGDRILRLRTGSNEQFVRRCGGNAGSGKAILEKPCVYEPSMVFPWMRFDDACASLHIGDLPAVAFYHEDRTATGVGAEEDRVLLVRPAHCGASG